MSSRPSTVPKPAVVLPKRTPVLIQPDSDQLFTNRIVGVATIVVYTSAVFIAGYLTGMYTSFPSHDRVDLYASSLSVRARCPFCTCVLLFAFDILPAFIR